MVVMDEAFRTAGQSPGIEIWRVKNFKVFPVPSSEHGVFYGGDSYIVLSTYGQVKNLRHNAHIWIGEATTADESGTAAIKTVELDDLLGGGPVQYREVQNHESALFSSYFKNGIRYLKGGNVSGFAHVDRKANLEPRLFHCKGRHTVRVSQVEVSRDSLNSGDAFILDTGGPILYVWLPPECSRLERIKAIEQARNIRDQERGGRGDIQVLDSDWDTNAGFWNILGGRGQVKSPAEAGNDDDFLKQQKKSITLYKVSDASGRLKVDKIAEGKLSKDMLDKNDAFILDTASGGLFVWLGKSCNPSERKNAMKHATDFLASQGRPKWVQIVRVVQGAEPAVFDQWFVNTPTLKPSAFTGASSQTTVSSSPFVFVPTLFQCSNASGKLSIQEIAEFSQKDLASDDVMVLDAGGKIFVWNGQGANDAERQAGQIIAKKYLEISAIPRPLGAKIETLTQGQEPREFTSQFQKWDPNYLKSDDLVMSVEEAMKNLLSRR